MDSLPPMPSPVGHREARTSRLISAAATRATPGIRHAPSGLRSVQTPSTLFPSSRALGTAPRSQLFSSRSEAAADGSPNVSALGRSFRLGSPAVRGDGSVGAASANTSILGQPPAEEPEEPLADSFATLLRETRASEYDRVAGYLQLLTAAISRRSAQLPREERNRWTNDGDRVENMQKELQVLRQERDTWLLASRILPEILDNSSAIRSFDEVVSNGLFPSDRDALAFVREETAGMRQHALVVEWLETVAGLEHKDLVGEVVVQADISHGWTHTMDQLKRERHSGQSKNTVTSLLDPDAVQRQQQPLAERDAAGEAELLRKLFALVRMGQMDKARELCRRSGQSWRAAAMEGCGPRHYENHTKDIQGFLHRDVWRSVCLRMCEDPAVNEHEKATFAVLSGNLHGLLPVCVTWHDALWAHYRTMVYAKTEERYVTLRQQVQPSATLARDLVPLAQLSPTMIFSSLENSALLDIKVKAAEPVHILQKLLILGDVGGLVHEMSTWAAMPAWSHYYRLFAHLAIFLRRLLPDQLDAGKIETILRAYAQHLVDTSSITAVATYTAELRPGDQVSFHAAFLAPIVSLDLRRLLLASAAQANLDTRSIAVRVVSLLFDDHFGLDTPENVSQLVRSLEWLLLEPVHRCCAVALACRIARHCLLHDRHDVALQALSKLPPQSDMYVADLKERGRLGPETHTEEVAHANAVDSQRETNCLQALLDALEMFRVWKRHVDVRPDTSTSEYAQWEEITESNTNFCEQKIGNVLMFPGGWLLGLAWVQNSEEHVALRRKYVPLLCRLLHTILYGAGRFQESLAIADIITGEQYRLLDVFEHDRAALRSLLDLLHQSAMATLTPRDA